MAGAAGVNCGPWLGVDLGGTKALLGWFAPGTGGTLRPRLERRYACDAFGAFDELLDAFVDELRAAGEVPVPAAACIGVAGPVQGVVARLTNRPWSVDADALGRRLGGAPVRLVNDFEAAAAGISGLGPSQLQVLQAGEPEPGAPRAVAGAGTGLGAALLIPRVGGWQVVPGEGGHIAFGPRDETELELWRFLRARNPRVSWERIVCGPGLAAVYAFARQRAGLEPEGGLLSQPDPAAAISAAALHELPGDPEATTALDLFASAFGAYAGDLALLAGARGGVYLAGGIAPRVFDARRTARFLDAFRDKGSHSRLMPSIPVSVVLEPRLGLLGAAAIAAGGDSTNAAGGDPANAAGGDRPLAICQGAR
jgi:glucokinase